MPSNTVAGCSLLIIMLVYPTMIWQTWEWVRDDSLTDLSDSGQYGSWFFFANRYK